MKDFPSYGYPKWRLGKWEINYGYRWVLTMPQIEIMQADLPHTLFNRKAKKGKRKKNSASDENYQYNPNDNAFALQREAVERRRKQLEAEGKEVKYTMDEIFNR